MDWDKPLSEQHPKVQEAINQLGPLIPRGTGGEPTGANAYAWLTQRKEGQMPPWDTATTSERFRSAGIPGIKYLDQGSRVTGGVNQLGGKWYYKGSSTPYATQAEAQAASDKAGNVTRNYVLFDDSMINILRKYGMAGLLPAAGAAGAGSGASFGSLAPDTQ